MRTMSALVSKHNIHSTRSLISFVEWWKQDIEKNYEQTLMEGKFLECNDLVDD